MNNLDKYAIWLQREEQDAEAFQDEAKTAPEQEYWRGYGEAIINAASACYGPTPLDDIKRLWVASDGSFGTCEIEQFNAEKWTHDDWQELDAANDWDRLAVAIEISRRIAQESGAN